MFSAVAAIPCRSHPDPARTTPHVAIAEVIAVDSYGKESLRSVTRPYSLALPLALPLHLKPSHRAVNTRMEVAGLFDYSDSEPGSEEESGPTGAAGAGRPGGETAQPHTPPPKRQKTSSQASQQP